MCWSVDEKAEDLTGQQLGGEEEKKDVMENSQQMQNNSDLSELRQDSADLKIPKTEQGERLRM